MKHLHGFRKLNMNSSHRKAMLSNMANSLLKHSRVITTLAKAKELRSLIERLVTRAKINDLSRRRYILKTLRRPDMLTKLFSVIAPAFKDRPGGYTRIIRIGFRRNDNAEVACLEFIQNFAEPKRVSVPKAGEAKKDALPPIPERVEKPASVPEKPAARPARTESESAAEKPKKAAVKPAPKAKAEKSDKNGKKAKEGKKKG